jgi:hypothetical protein
MRKIILAVVLIAAVLPLSATASQAAPRPFTVSAVASTARVVLGDRVTFTGAVRPKRAAIGQRVVLQFRYRKTGPWTQLRRARISDKGTYTVRHRPTSVRTHWYRIVKPRAGTRHARGVTPPVRVQVYQWHYLTDQDLVDIHYYSGGAVDESVDINGITYRKSLASPVWLDNDPAWFEYNLSRKCTNLRATYGLSDQALTGDQVEVSVITDGARVYNRVFPLGESESPTLNVRGVLRVRFQMDYISTGNTNGTNRAGPGAVGAPMALCRY